MTSTHSRARLGLLIGLLTTLWTYAIVTDHPAPAWGASRLPDLALATAALFGPPALIVVLIRTRGFRSHDHNA
ncbi:MAG: hypothetical protein U0835_16335 [Isosphaeraceae bacterium]